MTQLSKTLSIIDNLNKEDPVKVNTEHGQISKEILYSKRMQDRLNHFLPEAGETLQIAAYSQHVKRWSIPRSNYPMDRAGYKKWRTTLGQLHAETTAQAMLDTGYGEESVERVKYLLQKKGLKRDPETQALEDVICLVFIEYYLEDFATKHSEEKLIAIIQKTWKKMSTKGHAAALELTLPANLSALLKKALNT